MEQTAGEQATLCPSYGENLESANNGDHCQHVAISMHTRSHTWKGTPVLKCSFYHLAFVIIIFTSVILFFPVCHAHGGNSLNRDRCIVCVDMCVCIGFPLRGHSLSPCVILVSCSHGRCEIPTPVERITLTLCVCVCLCASVRTYVCMWKCLILKEVRLLFLSLVVSLSLLFCLHEFSSFQVILLVLWYSLTFEVSDIFGKVMYDRKDKIFNPLLNFHHEGTFFRTRK